MGADSKIEWTHHTFNPWWGCVRVSPGCEHCYAETFAKRVGQKVWGVNAARRTFTDKHWAEPLKWNAAAVKAGERHRVFCASMADVFENRRDLDSQREKLWALVDATPSLDWLLLTKRPQNIRNLVPSDWLRSPRPNVWYGATVEDQQRANERITALAQVPAAVRFLSCEPLLEAVDLGHAIDTMRDGSPALAHIDWVIVGGESGARSRVFDIQWARDIIKQCREAGVWVFMKQLGANPDNGAQPDGTLIKAYINDPKGGDWGEWPEDLRVREFPRAVNVA